VLATAHRAENVDDPVVLGDIAEILMRSPLPVVYPVHPRTVKRLRESGLYDGLASNENVQLLDPVGYFDFLVLMKRCSFIMTDSGGIQEEATAPNISKKVFVLRDSTERPEAVAAGYAEVVGTDPEEVLRRVTMFFQDRDLSALGSPFGEGKAGKAILNILDNSVGPVP